MHMTDLFFLTENDLMEDTGCDQEQNLGDLAYT